MRIRVVTLVILVAAFGAATSQALQQIAENIAPPAADQRVK